MKISETFYNEQGELMAPREVDVAYGAVTPGGFPTVEAGFYHRFKFEGRTPAERQEKLERFSAEMAGVPGYMTLTARDYEVRMDSFVRFGYDVLYVVEAPQVAGVARPTAPLPRFLRS